MKNTLITLTTKDDEKLNGEFSALFNDDIIIKPYSEVCLQSVSLNKKFNIISIDQNNDSLTFQVSASTNVVDGVTYGGQHTIKIDQGTYTRDNLLTLFKDIQTKMNQKLGVHSAKENGMEIRFGPNSTNKVAFEFKKRTIVNYVPDTPAGDSQINFVNLNNAIQVTQSGGLGKRLRATIPQANNVVFKNCLVSKPTISNGSALIDCKIHHFDSNQPAVPGGVVLGFILNNATSRARRDDGSLSVNDIVYGIRTNPNNLSGAPNNYFVKNGLGTDFIESTLLVPTKQEISTLSNNDVMFVRINKGQVEIGINVETINGGPDKVAVKVPHNYGTSTIAGPQYLAVLAIIGAPAQIEVASFRTTLTPYDDAATPSLDGVLYETVALSTPQPSSTTANTVFIIDFVTPSLADYFGFRNLLNTSDPTAIFAIESPQSMDNHIGTNTYLIELLQPFELNSYHSLAKGRKSILAPIPISEKHINESGQIQYEPNTLFYLSMNNPYPINLRNVRCRIIAQDFTTIQTEGESEIHLLIKED